MLFCCLDDLETADFITEEEKKLSGTTVIILIAFVFYLAMMIVIGAVYMKKTSSSEDYFLGGRGLNGWVAALSAQASDMSGWLLMGLPGAIYSDAGSYLNHYKNALRINETPYHEIPN